MADIDDILAEAKLAETLVPVCIRGDLQAEWEDLERQFKAARLKAAADTLAGGDGEPRRIAALMAKCREGMETATRQFKLQALPRKKWSDLVAAHEPRDEDKKNGLDYNAETFGVALLAASCVDPAMNEEQAGRLIETVLTQGQWDEIITALFRLNKRAVSVPFSASASAILAASQTK